MSTFDSRGPGRLRKADHPIDDFDKSGIDAMCAGDAGLVTFTSKARPCILENCSIDDGQKIFRVDS